MANHKSALKRHRQSLVRNHRNTMVRTRIKNVVKEVRTAVEANDKENASVALTKAVSVLDKAASKKVIHARCAARRISRLQTAVNKLS
ncbi:30S ribosomal protein S20 [Maridesulfovibrio bastinii]|uniref:30S ribosomal protein S20 n=1 Tax=Maridesulfovibrio bastinii TaxID=47157 RepID=UPI000482B3E2|nr:30S ribosomal protein S20 [Maridesulfovibrio bastinii]